MLMHGYQPVGAPVSTPMTPADTTPVFLKKGFAVAQSQYASQGWAVSDAIADNERLRQHFVRTYVQPIHTYIYGFSLGGLASATDDTSGDVFGTIRDINEAHDTINQLGDKIEQVTTVAS